MMKKVHCVYGDSAPFFQFTYLYDVTDYDNMIKNFGDIVYKFNRKNIIINLRDIESIKESLLQIGNSSANKFIDVYNIITKSGDCFTVSSEDFNIDDLFFEENT